MILSLIRLITQLPDNSSRRLRLQLKLKLQSVGLSSEISHLLAPWRHSFVYVVRTLSLTAPRRALLFIYFLDCVQAVSGGWAAFGFSSFWPHNALLCQSMSGALLDSFKYCFVFGLPLSGHLGAQISAQRKSNHQRLRAICLQRRAGFSA